MSGIARRRLGGTGLSITELGFGGGPIGNLYRAMTDDEAASAIDAAVDAGISYFDTAPHYGRGLSERRLGNALRGRPRPTISTKIGRLLEPEATAAAGSEQDGFVSPMPFRARFDYSYDGVLRSYHDSIQRLGLACIDLLYVHDIGRYAHGDRAAHHWLQLTEGGGLRALERLRSERLIAGFGVGVNETAVCLDVMREAHLDVILLAGRYTLLEQGALDGLMPACAAAGTAIVVGGPYNSGILASGTRSGATPFYDYAPAPEPIVLKVRQIERVADRHGVALPAAALRFVLAHPTIACVIPGLGSAALVAETVKLFERPIPDDFWRELRHEGIVRPDAPLPENA